MNMVVDRDITEIARTEVGHGRNLTDIEPKVQPVRVSEIDKTNTKEPEKLTEEMRRMMAEKLPDYLKDMDQRYRSVMLSFGLKNGNMMMVIGRREGNKIVPVTFEEIDLRKKPKSMLKGLKRLPTREEAVQGDYWDHFMETQFDKNEQKIIEDARTNAGLREFWIWDPEEAELVLTYDKQ